MSELPGKGHSWFFGLFKILVVLFMVTSLEGYAERVSELFAGQPVTFEDALGIDVSQGSSGEQGWREVVAVEPGGAADEAGLEAGDAVRFESFQAHVISLRPGERVPLLLESGGDRMPVTLVARQQPETDSAGWSAEFALVATDLVIFGFSLFLLIRGRGNRAATMLGLFLLTGSSVVGLAWLPGWTAPLVVIANWPIVAGLGYYILMFEFEISGGAASRPQARLAQRLAAAFYGVIFLIIGFGLFAIPSPLPTAAQGVIIIVLPVACGLGFVFWNYRRNNAATRNRIKIAASAFPLLLVLGLVNALLGKVGIDPLARQWFIILSEFAFVGLLAYAVLKQRLFDFGFAVNRTLVFGSVSFILLATFGLLEWSAEHFVPEAWHEGGPFISAALALGLFLSFHRMRDWVEKHIERLFFSSWQQAEAALKRFVESAGHFDKMAKLCGAFTDALSRFAGGADAALYLRDAEGAYRRQSGKLAGAEPGYGDDDPALALMRAERKPVELAQAHGALPGGLALPMLEQGTLSGFVLLAEKPDAAHYRPDEVENLGWAAHQVGLDLRALHARQLEAENGRMRDTIAVYEKMKAKGAIA